MNLITPSVELILQDSGLTGIYKQIELVGRSCWMSQNAIKEGSAKKFVDALLKNAHTSCLEHGTVYLIVPYTITKREFPDNYVPTCIGNYEKNKYSKVKTIWTSDDIAYDYVTTNFRVLIENDWLQDLQYISEPTQTHYKRYTFHFTCQRSISAEFNRHRANSPMESSSRYCNFSKDKFGNEISVCPSDWVEEAWEFETNNVSSDPLEYSNKNLEEYCNLISQSSTMNKVDWWWFANLACERSYMELIKLGCKPEEARDILPLDLKTELYHTAFVEDWEHFCKLRAWDSKGNKPHLEAKKLASQVWYQLVKLGEVDDDIRISAYKALSENQSS